METFLQEPNNKKRNGAVLAGAVIAGIVIVGAFLGLVSMKKSTQEVLVDAMQGAYKEGSPEFEKYTKKIVAETDTDKTSESPTGMGTITMAIHGRLHNLTGKTLVGLEIKVGVVDLKGNPVKEKTTIVIPKDIEKLEPDGVLPVQVNIDGFARDDDRANVRWKVTAIKVAD